MEFKVLGTEITSAGDIEEQYVFGSPKKSGYKCPSCSKSKRKFVLEFRYISSKLTSGFMKSYVDPYCENCFEFYEQGRLLNDFHKTDIY